MLWIYIETGVRHVRYWCFDFTLCLSVSHPLALVFSLSLSLCRWLPLCCVESHYRQFHPSFIASILLFVLEYLSQCRFNMHRMYKCADLRGPYTLMLVNGCICIPYTLVIMCHTCEWVMFYVCLHKIKSKPQSAPFSTICDTRSESVLLSIEW